MTALRDRLNQLDNRVFHMDERTAALATEVGWRKMAAQWRWLAALSGLGALVIFINGLIEGGGLAALGGFVVITAFRAGQLKGEEDFLNKRGALNRKRPAGLR